MHTRISTALRVTLLTPALALSLVALSPVACDKAPAPRAPALPAPVGAPNAAAANAAAGTSAATAPVDAAAWKTSTSSDDPNTLEVAGFRAPKPASWVWTKPSMQFRTLQYAVPGDGDSTKSADFIVSVFVAGDGGPIDANISRWATQFRNGDKPAEPLRSSKTLGPLKIELVELAGEYMAMGSPSPKPDSLQLAAIVQADGRNVFFRLVGPKDTVEANREAFTKLVDGLMPAN